MARLTWQNVSAPDTSGSAQTAIAAGRAFTGTFDNFADVMRNIQKERNNVLSNAELQKLAQVGGADQVDAYLQNMQIDPANMSPLLREQMLGLRATAQGYDTTRLTNANTESVINKRVAEQQFLQDSTAQGARFNAAQQEAYRLQRAGKHAEADAIIERAMQENPIAASQANPASIQQTLSGIEGAPNAYQFTDEGRAEKAAEQDVFKEALKQTDPERAKNAAYNKALSMGLNPVQAARLAEKSLTVFGAVPTGTGGILGDAADVPDGNGSGVVSPTNPLEANIDQIPYEATEADIQKMVEADPIGSSRLIQPQITSIDSALNSQGSNDIERAFTIMDSGENTGTSVSEIVKGLYADLGLEGKEQQQAEAKFNSAVDYVSRQAKVSKKAAQAAILSTTDSTNWYGAISAPSARLGAAITTAQELNKPEQHKANAKRKAELSNFRTDLADATAQIEKEQLTIARLSQGRNANMTQAEQATQLNAAKQRLARQIHRVSKLSGKVNQSMNLGFNAQEDIKADDVASSVGSSTKRTNTTDAKTVDETLDKIVPTLSDAGFRGSEIEAATPQIKRQIKEINQEYDAADNASTSITNILEGAVTGFKEKTSKSVLDSMTEGEVERAAWRDMSPQNLTKLKAEIRDIPELMKYDYMSATEFERALPSLMDDLKKLSTKNARPSDADIAKTILQEMQKK